MCHDRSIKESPRSTTESGDSFVYRFSCTESVLSSYEHLRLRARPATPRSGLGGSLADWGARSAHRATARGFWRSGARQQTYGGARGRSHARKRTTTSCPHGCSGSCRTPSKEGAILYRIVKGLYHSDPSVDLVFTILTHRSVLY